MFVEYGHKRNKQFAVQNEMHAAAAEIWQDGGLVQEVDRRSSRSCRVTVFVISGVEALGLAIRVPILFSTLMLTKKTNKTNSVALSPQANYTDWATATCRRNLVPTFVDREVSRGQRCGSPRLLIAVFYTGAATFLSSSSSFILTRAEWIPFQSHCYAENLVALGIEPGTSGLAIRNSDH
jgi:hypothetical protein